MRTVLVILLLLVVFAGGIILWGNRNAPYLSTFLGTSKTASTTPAQPQSTATFACDANKSIVASFYTGAPAPVVPGQPPQPTGSVDLTLSDGRTMHLPQTISGSGIRYATPDDLFVFWSKGNTAFVEEGPQQTQTYTGCIVVHNTQAEQGWSTFASSSLGFSLRYPQGYSLNSAYTYQALGPGRDIGGVKVTIPAALAQGTNLSSYDTGVSVEELPSAAACDPRSFLSGAKSTTKVSDAGTDYLVASSSGAGAGNLYEEEVWAYPDSVPCTAVRYFIHSTNIGNYPPGAVMAFDRAALLAQFDTIRRSVVLGR